MRHREAKYCAWSHTGAKCAAGLQSPCSQPLSFAALAVIPCGKQVGQHLVTEIPLPLPLHRVIRNPYLLGCLFTWLSIYLAVCLPGFQILHCSSHGRIL